MTIVGNIVYRRHRIDASRKTLFRGVSCIVMTSRMAPPGSTPVAGNDLFCSFSKDLHGNNAQHVFNACVFRDANYIPQNNFFTVSRYVRIGGMREVTGRNTKPAVTITNRRLLFRFTAK